MSEETPKYEVVAVCESPKEREVGGDHYLEQWLPVPGYEGLYLISNLGRLFSFGTYHHKPRIIKPYRGKEGYLTTHLYKDGHGKKVSIHRLVAEAFVPNPKGHPTVNHKDENKINNCAENLEWCTQEYNNNYGSRIERVKKSISQNTEARNRRIKRLVQNRSVAVLLFSADGELLARYSSISEASRATHISVDAIRRWCSGMVKRPQLKYRRYMFKYE